MVIGRVKELARRRARRCVRSVRRRRRRRRAAELSRISAARRRRREVDRRLLRPARRGVLESVRASRRGRAGLQWLRLTIDWFGLKPAGARRRWPEARHWPTHRAEPAPEPYGPGPFRRNPRVLAPSAHELAAAARRRAGRAAACVTRRDRKPRRPVRARRPRGGRPGCGGRVQRRSVPCSGRSRATGSPGRVLEQLTDRTSWRRYPPSPAAADRTSWSVKTIDRDCGKPRSSNRVIERLITAVADDSVSDR